MNNYIEAFHAVSNKLDNQNNAALLRIIFNANFNCSVTISCPNKHALWQANYLRSRAVHQLVSDMISIRAGLTLSGSQSCSILTDFLA